MTKVYSSGVCASRSLCWRRAQEAGGAVLDVPRLECVVDAAVRTCVQTLHLAQRVRAPSQCITARPSPNRRARTGRGVELTSEHRVAYAGHHHPIAGPNVDCEKISTLKCSGLRVQRCGALACVARSVLQLTTKSLKGDRERDRDRDRGMSFPQAEVSNMLSSFAPPPTCSTSPYQRFKWRQKAR